MLSSKRLKVEITLFAEKKSTISDEIMNSILENREINFQNAVQAWDKGLIYTFDDFKIDVNINKVYSEIGPTATIRIYGCDENQMNRITTVALKSTFISDKRVRIYADSGKGYNLLFEGWITEAIPVYSTVPDFYIQIESSMAAFENAMTPPPESIAPKTAIYDVCTKVCASYGVSCFPEESLKNKTVGEKPPRLDQIGLGKRLNALADMYGLLFIAIPGGYKVYDKESGSKTVFEFNPENYFGYPTFTKQHLSIQTDEFARIEIGDYFRISKSIIPVANGLWLINKINYQLQSRVPNGKWFASLYGTPIVLTSLSTGV